MFRDNLKTYRATDTVTLLAHYRQIETELTQFENYLSQVEKTAVTTFGYPSVDAARVGLRAYASGEAMSRLKNLEEMCAQLGMPKVVNKPKEDDLFDQVTVLAKQYVQYHDAYTKGQKTLRIVRGVLAEKGEVINSHSQEVIRLTAARV